MTRSSVVLPQPDGPSSATSSPGAIVRSIAVRTVCSPKRLLTPAISMRWPAARGEPGVWRSSRRLARDSSVASPLEPGFEPERDQGEKGEEGGE